MTIQIYLLDIEFALELILLEAVDLFLFSQFFSISSSGTITTIVSLDNLPNTLYILVQAAANGEVSQPQIITINVIQALSSQTFNIDPSVSIGVPFGQLIINDISTEPLSDYSFSIVDQPTLGPQFEIVSNDELALASGTLLSGQTYTITVRATHLANGSQDEAPMYIVVQSVPSIQNQTFNITTNFGKDQDIGAIFISGPDSNNITLTITNPNPNFELTGFTLKTTSTATLTASVVTLNVKATSSNQLVNTAVMTINITNYDTPIINPNQVFYIQKSSPVDSFVGYIGALDPNGGNITFTDTTTYTPTNPQLFTVQNSGAIFVNAPLTLDTQTLTINVKNPGGLTNADTIVINMVSVLLNQTFNINSTTLPNKIFASVLIDGNVDEYTLAISNNASPNFAITFDGHLSYSGTLGPISTSYSIGVTATNNTSSVVSSATITIIVSQDQLFSIIPDQTFTITNNQTVVGNIAYDNPSGGSVTFTSVSGSSAFSLSSSGLLSINGVNPGPGTYSLTVTANTISTGITVIILSTSPQIQNDKFSITTYYGANKIIGTIFVSDIDGDPVTLTIISAIPSSTLSDFTITNGNQLMTSSSFTNLSVETVTLTIEASDAVNTSAGSSQAKILIDVSASPFTGQNQTFIVSVSAVAGITLGPVVVDNPDNVPLQFALATSSVVSVNASTGVLTLVSTSIFSSQASCQVMVTVTSADNVSHTATLTLTSTTASSLSSNLTLIWILLSIAGLMGLTGITLGAIALSKSSCGNNSNGTPINVIKLS